MIDVPRGTVTDGEPIPFQAAPYWTNRRALYEKVSCIIKPSTEPALPFVARDEQNKASPVSVRRRSVSDGCVLFCITCLFLARHCDQFAALGKDPAAGAHHMLIPSMRTWLMTWLLAVVS